MPNSGLMIYLSNEYLLNADYSQVILSTLYIDMNIIGITSCQKCSSIRNYTEDYINIQYINIQ